MPPFTIEPATEADWPDIWTIFRQVAADGDTYPMPADLPETQGRAYWFGPDKVPFVARRNADGLILGAYVVKPNFGRPGPAEHIANAAYIVHPEARGLGVGGALGEHSLEAAKSLGYLALQFNLVVATNTASLRLWDRLKFQTLGTIPQAFRHPERGLVDAHILYRAL
jgi:L-amino acid N-acyltransferase YncA